MSNHFDVIVVGAGPGGYPAAIRASQLGLKVACIEKEKLGGICLNWGCVPSKALLKSAEFVDQIHHANDFGVRVGDVEVDFAKVVSRSRKVSERFVKGVKGLFKKYKVTSIAGTATIAGPRTLTVASADGEATYTADHIILATGARARTFPGIEPDDERILTYRSAIVNNVQPKSITILGAGAIGMEFAYFLNAMGTKVTVVEGQEEILPVEDREVAATCRKVLAKSGIDFKLKTMVDSVVRDGDETVVKLKDGSELRSEYTLISLGITPNSENIGLENVGIATERGFIVVDDSFRTNVSGFYAVGDVADKGPALAHVATRQAHVLAERIAGHSAPDVDYTVVPSCTYCQPQVASVGFTERAVKEMGVEYKVGKFPFIANAKSVGGGHKDGFVKVIFDAKYGELLGAHIVGHAATELIAEFALARGAELTNEEIESTIHAHPTASEVSMEAVAQAFGRTVHL